MKSWKRWTRGGLLAVGAPALSGCGLYYPNCTYDPTTVAWNGKQLDGGALDGGLESTEGYEVCRALCPKPNGGSLYCTSPDAGLLTCSILCGGGRAPPGLQSLSSLDGSAGSWLARMAELETAAVPAFSQLADELDAHGLGDLAHHARAAALDEVRHADVVTRLAMTLGHCPARVDVTAPLEIRSLEDIALDNAREGCGRELFGAVLNRHQASHAADARVRAAMGAIASDEESHARYALALADALRVRLTVAQRSRVREAQQLRLSETGTDAVSPAARRALGLMDAGEAERTGRALLDTARI